MIPEIPDGFIERYREILGSKLEKFIWYLAKPQRPSIRVNTLKTSLSWLEDSLKENYDWDLERFKWLDHAFYLNYSVENPGATLEHTAGFYYVQGDSSMIPAFVLDPKPGELVLDITAAPGSKTTQMCQYMRNTGAILANETSKKRAFVLYNNLKRFGCYNTRVRIDDGRRIPGSNIFDKALVDAPCSNESSMLSRKVAWSENMILSLSNLQKGLLRSAIRLTKPGGTIVYSTCTFEPEENEEVVDWAVENLPVKLMPVHVHGLKLETGLPGYECSKHVSRIWPWDGMQGFFIARMVKTDG